MLSNGIFENTENAVAASVRAFNSFLTFTVRERGEIIKQLRIILLDHARELALMEREETGMGVCGDKLAEIVMAASRTRGNDYIFQDAISGGEGIALQEEYPFGVSGVIHPVTHPTASIINSTILMLSAGNSVIHLIPRRAEETCQYLTGLINKAIADICGMENLVICLGDNRYEYIHQIMEHPDVSLVVVTGGSDVVNLALAVRKKVIVAGNANPVAIVDSSANLHDAARNITEAVTFDNNLLCTSEKSAVVLRDVYEAFRDRLKEQGALLLLPEQVEMLKGVVFDEDMRIRKECVGQDADTLLKMAGIHYSSEVPVKMISFDASALDPFVVNEVAAPILPLVEAPDFEEALLIANFIEQGYNHTASIFSRDINHLSAASRLLRTAVFVKNGSTLYGSGMKGDMAVAFTIANVTGEGPVVNSKTFSRSRKCMLVNSFEKM